jgi:uncharacterized protein YegP (UPF0339 family)
MGKIEIYKGEDKQFYFRIKSDNGEIIAVSEGYTTKQNCKNGIESVRMNVNADIHDLTIVAANPGLNP